jgi:hypothetical protein
MITDEIENKIQIIKILLDEINIILINNNKMNETTKTIIKPLELPESTKPIKKTIKIRFD